MTPEENLVFKDTIKKMLDSKEIVIDGNPNIDIVRGISLKGSNRIFINLSARQFSFYTNNMLEELLTQTIIHEHIHLLSKEYTGILNGASFMEERVCKIMAGQIELEE